MVQAIPSPTDWREFLERHNRVLLNDETICYNLPPEIVSSGWLGYDGASEEEIASLEQRIGTPLPASYRNFLTVSNGWRNCGSYIYDMCPSRNVRWFSEENQFWIDCYVGPYSEGPPLTDEEYLIYGDDQDAARFRPEYLQTALQISEIGDAAVILLNPKTLDENGEWEAMLFANWLPGASRSRSFWELMQEQHADFCEGMNQ